MRAELPETVVLPYAPWPDDEGAEVEFRLVYQGRLPAQSNSESRLKDKHAIRRVFHKQLKALWDTHPFITRYREPHEPVGRIMNMPFQGIVVTSMYTGGPTGYLRTIAERIGKQFARCGYYFVPLIGGAFGAGTETVCALDILFLRRDPPGRGLVVTGGDIDNRLKVLFDAMRIPENCDEVRGYPPAEGEAPFFCLLQNDNLITEVKVTTDQLLTPITSEENINDVHLIISVKSMAVGSEFADIGLSDEELDKLRQHDELVQEQYRELARRRKEGKDDERTLRAMLGESIDGDPPKEGGGGDDK